MARYIWEDLNLWDSQRMVLVTEDMQEVLQVLVSNMKTGVGLFELMQSAVFESGFF